MPHPYVFVVICGRNGWDTRAMSLRNFARARASLERLEVLHVSLVGGLA